MESGFQVFKRNHPNTFTMRLNPDQIHAIVNANRAAVRVQAGDQAGEQTHVR